MRVAYTESPKTLRKTVVEDLSLGVYSDPGEYRSGERVFGDRRAVAFSIRHQRKAGEDVVMGRVSFRVLENAAAIGGECDHISARYERGEMIQPVYYDSMRKMRWREIVKACKAFGRPGRIDELRRNAEVHVRFEGGHGYYVRVAKLDLSILAQRGCVHEEWVKSKYGKGKIPVYEYVRDFDEETDWVPETDSHEEALRRCGKRARDKWKARMKVIREQERMTKAKGTLVVDYDFE